MTTKISISGIIKANAEKCLNAYLFSRTLASLEKHPIILNYKAQITSIRQQLNMSDYMFRKSLNSAVREGFAEIEGKHLRLFSNNKDRAYKPNKKNDYRTTKNPQELAKIAILEDYEKKQRKLIAVKSRQTVYSVCKKGDENSIITYDNNKPNQDISCSVRGIAKLFNTSITSAHTLIKYMEAKKHIRVTKNAIKISKADFQTYLKQCRPNIRYANGTYHYIKASTFTMLTSTKRRKYEPFYSLPEHIQNSYLEQGYTVDQVNRLIG